MSQPDAATIRKLWSQTICDQTLWDSGDPSRTYKPEPDSGTVGITIDTPPPGAVAIGLGPATPPTGITIGAAPHGAVAAGPEGATPLAGITVDVPGLTVGVPSLPTKTTVMLPPTSAGRPASAVPSDNGDFELVEQIGEGGMGVIWRARQLSLAREVALKQSKFDPRDVHARFYAEHFVAEARVTGFLDHPNIVPVHAIGQDATGRLFLSMKLVQGTSWRDLLHPWNEALNQRAAKLDLDAHLGILLAVCNAVAFAHSRNFAHLDLKPANVMVGEFGEVLVMDWGIAVDISEQAGRTLGSAGPAVMQRARHHTAVMAPAGTPAYIAPEMAQGRGSDIGRWTDVYLLGSILHEIVTGEPPHRGDSISDVLREALRSGPKRYGPHVPQALAEICRTAMARETRDRYQSVGEFQDALRNFLKYRESLHMAERAGRELEKLAGPDVRYRDTTRRYETYADVVSRYRQALELWDGNDIAREGLRGAALAYCRLALDGGDLGLASAQLELLPWEDADAQALRARIDGAKRVVAHRERTQRLMRGLSAGLVAVVFAGVTVGFFWIRSERDVARQREEEATRARLSSEGERRKAVAQRENAEREEAKSAAVLAFLQRMLSSAAPEHGGRDVRVLDMLERSDEQIRTEFGDRPEIRTTIQHSIAQTYLSLGEFARAEAQFAAAAELRATTLGSNHPDTLASLFELANVRLQRGATDEAARMLWDVADRRSRVLGAEHRDTLRSNAALARLALYRGDDAGAEKLLRETIELQRRAVGPQDRDTLDSMFGLASALRNQGKIAEAQEALKQLLEAELAAFAEKHPGVLPTQTSAQSNLNIQRRLLETEGGLRAWLSQLRLGDRTPEEYNAADNVADVLRSLSKGGEAARVCRDIITIRARLLGADHPRTLSAMQDLGLTLLDDGEIAEAETTVRAVVRAADRVLGLAHPDSLRYRRGLARVHVARAELAEARSLLSAAHRTLSDTLGPRHPEALFTAYDLAAVAYAQKEYTAAAEILRELIERAGPRRIQAMPSIRDANARLEEALQAAAGGT